MNNFKKQIEFSMSDSDVEKYLRYNGSDLRHEITYQLLMSALFLLSAILSPSIPIVLFAMFGCLACAAPAIIDYKTLKKHNVAVNIACYKAGIIKPWQVKVYKIKL